MRELCPGARRRRLLLWFFFRGGGLCGDGDGEALGVEGFAVGGDGEVGVVDDDGVYRRRLPQTPLTLFILRRLNRLLQAAFK